MITSILIIMLGNFGFLIKAQLTSYGSDEEDQYDEVYYSDEYVEEPETTTTEKPGLVLDGWHYGMLTAGASIAAMATGAFLGAATALRKVRKEDALDCDCALRQRRACDF